MGVETMSNPYMRDALMDEMEENSYRLPGQDGNRRADEDQPVSRAYENPWDNPTSSQRAPRIVQRNGQTYLTEHGNERLLQPNDPLTGEGETADATAYRDSFWQQYPTGFQPGVGPQRNEDYAAPAQQSAARPPLGQSGSTAGRFSGFDFNRAQDPTTSAKDLFAQLASQATWMPTTKDEAEEWFREFIMQGMNEAGYSVSGVTGDKAYLGTRENPGGEEIDFLINAGGDDPMLGWQSNMAGMESGSGGGPGGSGTGTAADSLIFGDDSATDDIDAAIQQLLESGMSYDEILAMLTAQQGN